VLQLVQLGMSIPPIITRAQARAAGLDRYRTGKACKHGHFDERRVNDGGCIECSRAKAVAWRAANYEKEQARTAAYSKAHVEERRKAKNARRAADPERSREEQRAWRAANPDHGTAWYAKHRERITATNAEKRAANREGERLKRKAWRDANPETARECALRWYRANPDRYTEYAANRRARLRQAVPGWFDREAVALIYAEAAALTEATGVLHHVDHLIPLKGKTVCGLHVQGNLKAVPAPINLRKSNKLVED
jgi:hypothetical protein